MNSLQNIDVVITGNVAFLDIEWEPKILYGIIRGLTRNVNFCCYASNEYLAELLQRDASTVRRYLGQLRDLGVIYTTAGYIVATNDDIVYEQRLIVLTELRKKFEKAQETLLDLKKSGKKNSVRVRTGEHPRVRMDEHLNIKYNTTNDSNITSKDIFTGNTTPKPPCKVGEKAVEQTEPFLMLGKYKNVKITQSQKTALEGEYSAPFIQSLIEQLSAHLKSGVKRFRKTVIHAVVLEDWALRRTERLHEHHKRVIVGGCDLDRPMYTRAELDALFTELDEGSDAPPSGEPGKSVADT